MRYPKTAHIFKVIEDNASCFFKKGTIVEFYEFANLQGAMRCTAIGSAPIEQGERQFDYTEYHVAFLKDLKALTPAAQELLDNYPESVGDRTDDFVEVRFGQEIVCSCCC